MKKDRVVKGAKIFEELEKIAPILPAPIIWADIHSVVLGANELLLKGIGALSYSDIVGKTPYEFYPYGIADHIVRHTEEVIRTGKILSQEEAIEDIGTGQTRYFTAIKAPLHNEKGIIIGAVGTSIEITEQKKAEEQLKIAKEKAEQALKAKSDFLAVVSHELRTPLTGILGMVEILQTEQLEEAKKKEFLSNIDTASKHLLTIINNILDFAKLNENKFKIIYTPFDLLDTFKKALEIIEAKALEKGLTLRINYSEAMPRYFIGDEKALLHVFINIIGNAIKFTEKGGITVTVTEGRRDSKHIELCILIEDTGIGIPKDKLEKIFERFEQVNSSLVRAYGGTGLGLSVSQKLIELMGGTISVTSELGLGSTFIITLPLELDLLHSLVHKRKKEENRADEVKIKQGIRVLLVEDDAVVQMVHKYKILKLGCIVETASNGMEALKLHAAKAYDVVLMDIGLPDMTGNEVIREIRAQEAGKRHVCIIALTAYADEENRRRVRESGADTVLSKPIEDQKLIKLLQKYC